MNKLFLTQTIKATSSVKKGRIHNVSSIKTRTVDKNKPMDIARMV
jgi:hypothetical protein